MPLTLWPWPAAARRASQNQPLNDPRSKAPAAKTIALLPFLSSGRGPRHTASARREWAQVVVDGRGDESQVVCRARATGLWRLHDAGGDAHNQWPSAPAERMLTRKTWLQRLAWMYTASILLRKRHTQCSLHARGQPLPIPRPPNSLVLRGRASPLIGI